MESEAGSPSAEFGVDVRVYYEDTDAAGIVYYANYLGYLERARTDWLRALGFDQSVVRDRHDVVFTVSRMEIEYLRPARLDDCLRATVEPIRVGHASLALRQRVLDRGGEPLVTAMVRIACVNAGSLRPSAMPRAMRAQVHRELIRDD